MKVTIVNKFTPQGQEFYEWWLADGPDGVEEVHGYATDLITSFSKILEWHERIASDYAQEVISEIETAKQFIQNDETHD
jgi:hypothetical protein